MDPPRGTTSSDPVTGLAKLIFDLGDLLERHIRKEERELFPLFEEAARRGTKPTPIGVEIKTMLETKRKSVKMR